MKKNVKNPWTLTFIIFVVAFVTSLISISYKVYLKHQESMKFEKLTQEVEADSNPIIESEEPSQADVSEAEEDPNSEEIPEKPTILPDYEKLYEENNDLYGWIRIDDTVINYPVMYSPYDPELYLHADFSKNDSISGTPFVLTPDTENIIIFAHNMKNRTMFGSLREYKDVDYYEEHKYIEFDTLYEKALYEIVAVSKAIAYYDAKEIPDGTYLFYEHTSLSNEDEFNAYIENAKENEYFDTGVEASYGDSLITLCTCDYWTTNARLIIVAKKSQPN